MSFGLTAGAGAKIALVTYVGDGNPSHIIALPFTPKFLVFDDPKNRETELLNADFTSGAWAYGALSAGSAYYTDISSSTTLAQLFPTNTSIDVGVLNTATGLDNFNGTHYRIFIYA